jgi:hypothetical protein
MPLSTEHCFGSVYVDLPNAQSDHLGRLEPFLQDLIAYIGNVVLRSTTVEQVRVYGVYKTEARQTVLLSNDIAKINIRGEYAQFVWGNRKKDIDHRIVNDIWRNAAYSHIHGRRKIRHVLVSGDSDYQHPYASMRGLLKGRLDIELAILSLRESCAPTWHSIADEIHYLEEAIGVPDDWKYRVARL